MHDGDIEDSLSYSAQVEKGLGSPVLVNAKAPTNSGTSTPFSARDVTIPEFSNHSIKAKPRSAISKAWHWITQKSNPGGEIDTSLPPDGGLLPWLTVFFCFMTGFNTVGLLNAYGVLQTYYTAELDLPPSTISWIGSLQAFLLFFCSTFSGRFTDAGYFHQVLFVGSCLMIVGIFTLAESTTYYQILLSHGVCVGLGGGLAMVPTLSLVGTYFSTKRPLTLAICAVGNSLGGLVFAAILEGLLPSVGFKWAIRVIGFLVLVTMVPANLILRPRKLERKHARLIEWSAFGESIYCCFSAGMFFSMLGMWVPVFYLGSFGRDIIGISADAAPSLILIINGVGVLGRVIPALLASRLGPLNLMIPLSLFTGIILLFWALVKTYAGVLGFDVIYAFIMASAQGMFPPSLGSLTSDLSKMGVRMGMVFSLCGFALLAGQPIAGALITLDGGRYLYAQMFSGVAMIIGVGFLQAARVLKVGWRWDAKV